MKIWLDKTRPMPRNYDIHVKTAVEAIKVLKNEEVRQISLGEANEDVYKVTKWIAENAYHGRLRPLGWSIHAVDPTACKIMTNMLRMADTYWSNLTLGHSNRFKFSPF
jgi:hypothetical protein